MMKFIIAPLVGGIIGYITNDLAIKMLFHPRKSYYIGKFHIPFTPGLIPQNKNRVARSVGRVVSLQLLNADTLRNTALSEKTICALRKQLGQVADQLETDTRTLRDVLGIRFSAAEIKQAEEKLNTAITEALMQKISSANIGKIVADSIMGDRDVQRYESAQGTLRNTVAETLANTVNAVVEKKIREKGPELIHNEISKESEAVLDWRLCDIHRKYGDRIPDIVDGLMGIYVEVVTVNLEKVLGALNVEKIVVDKISSFDSAQLETMIFGIMNKELKAIVYLGAALGFLMGFVNLLF